MRSRYKSTDLAIQTLDQYRSTPPHLFSNQQALADVISFCGLKRMGDVEEVGTDVVSSVSANTMKQGFNS